MLGIFRSAPQVYKSVNDIEARLRVRLDQKGKAAIRREVKIIVIDDQPFAPAVNLKNNGYLISQINTVEDFDQLRPYPIVLCDLQGVGINLDPVLQGAHLIKEIKLRFPEKVVIAYTGIAKTLVMARTAEKYADDFIKKDETISNWIEVLDKSIDEVSDPVAVWKKFRVRLLDAGATPHQLMVLEHAFVVGLEAQSQEMPAVMENASNLVGLRQDIRPILQGVASSIIYDVVFGG